MEIWYYWLFPPKSPCVEVPHKSSKNRVCREKSGSAIRYVAGAEKRFVFAEAFLVIFFMSFALLLNPVCIPWWDYCFSEPPLVCKDGCTPIEVMIRFLVGCCFDDRLDHKVLLFFGGWIGGFAILFPKNVVTALLISLSFFCCVKKFLSWHQFPTRPSKTILCHLSWFQVCAEDRKRFFLSLYLLISLVFKGFNLSHNLWRLRGGKCFFRHFPYVGAQSIIYKICRRHSKFL